jgi:hypothetical protein
MWLRCGSRRSKEANLTVSPTRTQFPTPPTAHREINHLRMYQTFYIGDNVAQRNHRVGYSTIKTLEQLRATLGELFSFVDEERKPNHPQYPHSSQLNSI